MPDFIILLKILRSQNSLFAGTWFVICIHAGVPLNVFICNTCASWCLLKIFTSFPVYTCFPGPSACVMVMNVPSERTRNIFHSTPTTAVYGKVRKFVLQTLPPCVVQCRVCNVQCTGYSVPCTVHSTEFTVHSVVYTVTSVQCRVRGVSPLGPETYHYNYPPPCTQLYSILYYPALLPYTPRPCTVLCCTWKHCFELHCTVLWCTALHCDAVALHCDTLRCTVICCTALYRVVQHCDTLNCTVMCCSSLQCIVLKCTA